MSEADLIAECMGFLGGYAKRLHAKSRRIVPVDDLIQYGAIGIIEAVRRDSSLTCFRRVAWTSMVDGLRAETHRGLAVSACLVTVDGAADHTAELNARIDIQRGMGRLTPSVRSIMQRRLSGLTQKEIAERRGMTEGRISQIEIKAVNTMRLAMAAAA